MGPQMRQLLATHCVASSLALVALGGSNPSSGFGLRTLSFGTVGDMTSVSCAVIAGVMCEE
jgi:hypothetical protein